MKLLLEIKEDKFPFVMELLGNFKFVRMKDVSIFTPQLVGDTDKGTEASNKAGSQQALPFHELTRD